MSAQEFDDDDDLLDEDLLPDDLNPSLPPRAGKAVPVKRSKAAQKAIDKAEKQREAMTQSQMLAQIVNLHIGGYSLADIGASIGATEAEVDRLLMRETSRYVKTQPALRTYVRNYISAKYTELLDSVWDKAVDDNDPKQLEYWDRAQKGLAQMGRLHGAEAPTQSEVKVEAAPETVEKMVSFLSSQQGMGYDADIFSTPRTVVGQAVEASRERLAVSGNAVEESDGHDDL